MRGTVKETEKDKYTWKKTFDMLIHSTDAQGSGNSFQIFQVDGTDITIGP